MYLSQYCKANPKLLFEISQNLLNSYSPRDTAPREIRSFADKAQQSKVKSINSDWHRINDPTSACVERDLKITLEKIRRMDKVVPRHGRSITIVFRTGLRPFSPLSQMHRARITYNSVHTWRMTGSESLLENRVVDGESGVTGVPVE